MNYIYCKLWHPIKRRPKKILTESDAKIKYNNGERLFIIVEKQGEYLNFIEVLPTGVIFINFLDDSAMEYLTYEFDIEYNTNNKGLLLSWAHFHSDKVYSRYCFCESGDKSNIAKIIGKKVSIVETNKVTKNITNSLVNQYEDAEEVLLEPVPKFGEWDSILREDRGMELEKLGKQNL